MGQLSGESMRQKDSGDRESPWKMLLLIFMGLDYCSFGVVEVKSGLPSSHILFDEVDNQRAPVLWVCSSPGVGDVLV